MSNILLYEDEAEQLAHDLEAVLTYASSLQSIAESNQQQEEGVPSPKNSNVMRDDLIKTASCESVLSLAPEREGDYFVVPKIIKNS